MTADVVGGVWSYAVDLCRGLAEHGVETVLAAQGGPVAEAQRRQVAALPTVSLREGAYRLEWMDDPWDDVARGSDWLLEIEHETNPDLIHLNEYARGGLPWRAPAVVVGHSCVVSWWRAVKGSDPPPRYDRYRREVRAGIGSARAIVAPTGVMLAALAEHYGIGHGTVARVIPNGRDASFDPPVHKEPIVLAAGRVWDEAKNVAALGRIARTLPWPVLVAGAARHPDGRVADVGAARSLGHLTPESLARWYRRAAIFAHPARYEPFGLSVLEAALAGCALVLGDIPSLREVWGDAARFVPPDDDEAIRHAIRTLIDDAGARAELAARALHRARYFTVRRMAGAYLNLYREILQR